MKSDENYVAILQIKDASGVIDEYLYYFLKSLKVYVTHITVICCRTVSEKEQTALKKYVNTVVTYDEMQGAEAVFLDYCNHKIPASATKVLLCDDSFYGPIYSLEDIFMDIKAKNAKLWGLLPLGEGTDSRLTSMHTCFVVIERDLFVSALEKFEEESRSREVAAISEIIKKLLLIGHKWESYIKLPKEWTSVKEEFMDYSILLSYELVDQFACPFVVKQALLNKSLEYTDGSNARNTMDFIDKCTDYDTNFIWKNLLRTCHILDIKEALCLEYICSHTATTINRKKAEEKKAAIIIHMHYEDLVDTCFSYIRRIPRCMDIYITTTRPDLKQKIEEYKERYQLFNCTIIMKENRGRDISALLVSCKEILLQYEYLCFIHDKKTLQVSNFMHGKTWMYDIWENTIKSADYIWNMIQCFDDNKRLGVLSVPVPYHGSFLGSMGNLWENTYEETLQLSEKLGLASQIVPQKNPFIVSTAFWCRTRAMKPLFEYPFQYEDFPEEPLSDSGTLGHAVERIIPYVAQDQGYYSGIVMNEQYAAMRSTDMQYLLEEAMHTLNKDMLISTYLDVKCYDEKIAQVLRFCKKYTYLFIYGTGKYGQRYGRLLQRYQQNYEGYIISDGQPREHIVLEHRVRFLSDIHCPPEECGIILAVNKKIQVQIVPQIIEKGYDNLYYVV